jgi:molecular chaperone DnaK
MSKIIGIDLGTTNSCVAVLQNNEVVVIPNSEGSRTTPSIVGFTDEGERVVGQIATRQAVTNASNTVYAVKRLIGRRYDSREVSEIRKTAPYVISSHTNGDAWVDVRGRKYSPSEISAMVLQKMKQSAEDFLGEEVTEAVITVPAYFNDSQRQATKDAGRIAGLDVRRIINEPTAAAIAYGLDQHQDGIIAVYDMGGGTFDISVLELSSGVFRVLATHGDTFLGGEDFDQRIVTWLIAGFSKQTGLDLRKDQMALQRLKEAAERAKHELSTQLETQISLPFIMSDATGPKHLEVALSRAQLEDMVADLVDRSLGPCQQALDEAGLTVDEIQDVVMVGGMTRMPLIIQSVTEFFRLEPHTGLNPDEVVAMGASVQGGVMGGELTDVVLIDVLPLSLGVETMGGVFTTLIEKNTPIPATFSEIFSTAVDNQPLVSIHILQGERQMAADNHSLARFDLLGIPPAPRGVPQVEVSLHVDANGILSVTAKDLGSGKEQQVRVSATGGLKENEIQRMMNEADRYKEDDALRHELAQLRNKAAGLIYTADRSLQEYKEYLNPAEREVLLRDIRQCREELETNDPEVLRTVIGRLEKSAHRIAEVMYSEMVYNPEETAKK